MIDIADGQRIAQARAELAALGVDEIRVDHLRGVGRGGRGQQPKPSQLCGHCGQDKVAVSTDGS